MSGKNLSIDIDVKLNIAEETAKFCLGVVEKYCNDNFVSIAAERQPDGKNKFHFENDVVDRLSEALNNV